jgi:hypothetical protein
MLAMSCQDPITGGRGENLPPKTYVWTDTLGVTQTSRVRMYWWGDDPDGFVQGYLVSFNGIDWEWTTDQERILTLQLGGVDSLLAQFRGSAVDMEGNGQWDANIISGNVSFGPEPYDDLDSNGVYSPGEPFVDYGAVDPTPSRLEFEVQNSPPTMAFAENTDIPAVTLPVASFLLDGRDLDGDETVVRYMLALNDTSAGNWIEVPGSVRLITLVADFSTITPPAVPADIYAGTEQVDLGISIPNLRLDAENVLYAYCVDLAGAQSDVVRMPDTTRTWTVRRPIGRVKLLLVDDYAASNPNPDDVYRTALQNAQDGSASSFGDYDVLDLRNYPIPAPLHQPMISLTLGQYPAVFWYAKIANLNYAHNTLPPYMVRGGKVLMTTGFENFIDVLGLPIDFAPIDSLVTGYVDSTGGSRPGYISRVYMNSIIQSTDTTAYPRLLYDRTALFGTYAAEPSLGATALYRLDLPKNPPNALELWVGTPPVGIRSASGNIIFMTVPMHLMNTTDPQGNRLVRFFESVLRDDFGL